MKHDFHQRKANRIEAAQMSAEKNRNEAAVLYERAKDLAAVIPMGQPILVGHHSEKKRLELQAENPQYF